MLARRREQIVLILGLAVANVLLGWYLVRLWRTYCSNSSWIYARTESEQIAAPTAELAKAESLKNFADIVDGNLFSPQRTSQPLQPAQEVKPPELPLLYGTMDLGNGWFALMASGGESSPVSKRVLPGDEIDGYKLVSIGTSQVVLSWQQRMFTVDVSESARRVPRIVEKAAPAQASSAPPRSEPPPSNVGTHTVAVAPVKTSSGAAVHQVSGYIPPGVDADAPEGTVADGRRKVVVPTPFGPQVRWVPVEPAGSQVPNSNPRNQQP
jgi:hypothetical protein